MISIHIDIYVNKAPFRQTKTVMFNSDVEQMMIWIPLDFNSEVGNKLKIILFLYVNVN